MAEFKTNVMRILDKAKVKYSALEYPHEDGVCVDGVTVAEELDFKKAAKAVGEKSVEMIHVSEINAVTGYIRGGCSPIGMKKRYKTVFHSSALEQKTVTVSAGRIGYQISLAPQDLISLSGATTADIIR